MNAFFGPWVGELGWELMAWQGYCRAKAKIYDKVYVSSFPDMEFLYQDFADEFIPHDYPNRKLKFEDIDDVKFELPFPDGLNNDHFSPFKRYKLLDQEFIQFGKPISFEDSFDVLIHARNIRTAQKNYPEDMWEKIVDGIREVYDTKNSCLPAIASIGKAPDLHIKGTRDLRGIPLSNLCDHMATCGVVIGGSSGVMHLATLCKAPIVVWGDHRTYFHETLETRYKETWNPFGSEVHFVFDDQWIPNPQTIVDVVKDRFEDREKIRLTPDSINFSSTSCFVIKDEGKDEAKTLEIGSVAAEALTNAVKSGRYLLTISYVTKATSKAGRGTDYKFVHNLTKMDFPDDQVIACLNHLRKEISQSPSAKAGLRQLLSDGLSKKKRFT